MYSTLHFLALFWILPTTDGIGDINFFPLSIEDQKNDEKYPLL